MEFSKKDILLFDEYLNILQLPKKPPSMDALRELLASHLFHVPFENISKLYCKKKFGLCEIPNLEEHINGIKNYNFGGTCYANNYYFYRLLKYLGYNITLCGADMNEPDVHAVSIVNIEDHEYILDVGYAAPFFEPLPRNIPTEYQIDFGNDKYILLPQDSNGFSKLNFYRNDILKHSYMVKPYPRSINDFAPAIEDSFSEKSTFMNSILIVSYKKNYLKAIYNFSLIEYSNNAYTTKKIPSKNELAQEIEKEFGMPSEIAYKALTQVNNFNDAWN